MMKLPRWFAFRLLAVSLAGTFSLSARTAEPGKVTRIACVGDSITDGVGTADKAFDAYPAQLQRMLDEHWRVGNFGSSGRTLLNAGDHPYQTQGALKNALSFQPDIVVIMLGTNDTKPQNWKFKDRFAADYQDLIGKFKALANPPRIYVCRPVPVSGAGNFGINEAVIQEEIPIIDQVAQVEKVSVIDLHAALTGHDELLPDRVHPNTAGAHLMARAVYRALLGKEFTGELASTMRGDWNGFQRTDFKVGKRTGSVIEPQSAAAGGPWIWRMEFFGTEPQVDLALLARGYHLAYLDVQNLYGAPAALDAMDQFYARVIQDYRLSPQPVLEGFSRGGLFAFHWAARHPAQVASLYLDAPVCDFKSWPAGQGQGTASPQDWQRLLKAYALSEEQALEFKLNPVDNLKPLADAKIPILSVCGDADKTVPFAENTGLVESRYRALGGEIKVLVKPGADHHPHSLKDPAPIVDFILAHPRR